MAVEPLAINVRKVRGRRVLSFASLEAMLADAELLVRNPATRTLGNWPLSRLLTHLATAIDGSVDGITTRAPWWLRTVAPLVKRRVIRRGVPPGSYRLPADVEARLYPPAATPAHALEILRTASSRIGPERMTAVHPVFGRITHDEWLQMHLRHAEMHLGFAVPE